MDIVQLLAFMFILEISLAQDASNCRESYIFGNTKTGVHDIIGPANKGFKVFCQFAGDGRGLVFPTRGMFDATGKDPLNTSFLYDEQGTVVIRIFNKDGTQSDTTIKQLPAYSTEDIDVFVNAHTGYSHAPMNPRPYIYVGLLRPAKSSIVGATLGFLTNGQSNTYRQCDKNPSNRFVFYPDKDSSSGTPKTASPNYALFKKWMASRFRAEIAFGGCGTLTPSSMWPDAKYAALGLPFGKINSFSVLQSNIEVAGCHRFKLAPNYAKLKSNGGEFCPSQGVCRMMATQPVSTSADYYAFHVKLFTRTPPNQIGEPGIAFNVRDLDNFEFVFFRIAATDSVVGRECMQHGYVAAGKYHFTHQSTCTGSALIREQWFSAAVVTKNRKAHIQLDGKQYATYNTQFAARAQVGLLVGIVPRNVVYIKEAKVVF